MNINLSFTLLFFLGTLQLTAQTDVTENIWKSKLESWKIQPVIGVQLWSTYTFGTEIYNSETSQYETVDNRFNTQLHRSRFGITGQPYQNLKFNFTAAIDFIGKDLYSGTEGGANNGASPTLRLWNAFLQWKISSQHDGLHLTVGYFTPQIGRENITPALRSGSVEKSWSQNYMRRHLVGTGPGRAVGINLGGLFLKENIGVSYSVGIFNPVLGRLSGNSTGSAFSTLLTGRVAFHFGDPEFKQYTIGHKINYFGKRKGLTLGLAVAQTGETDLFTENNAYGIDLLFNWSNWNIWGEWTLLTRAGNVTLENNTIQKVNVTSNTGFLALGYNIPLKNEKILEPVIMLVQFNGPLGATEQGYASTLGAFAGQDHSVEASLNLYVNPDLKLSLSYTLRSGDLGDADPGATFNNYFFQSGAGAIRRGDWLGAGVVAIF